MEARANQSRWWTVLIATLAWTGLGLQFYITLGQSMATGKTVGSAIAFYLSFFTILTNLLVASATTFSSLGSDSRLGRFFGQPAVLTAIGIYISVVGVVYSLVLRELWSPTRLQKVADLLLMTLFQSFTLRFGSSACRKVAFAGDTHFGICAIRSYI